MSWMFLKKCVTLSLWSLVAQSPSFFLSWPRLRSAPTYQENFVTLNLEFLDQMKWCIMNGVESNITCIISNQKSQVHSWSIGPYIGTSRSLWIRLWTGHDSGLPNGLVVTTNSFPFFEFDFLIWGLNFGLRLGLRPRASLVNIFSGLALDDPDVFIHGFDVNEWKWRRWTYSLTLPLIASVTIKC